MSTTVLSKNYLDPLLDEWGVDKYPPRLKARIRRILGELCATAHFLLLRAPSLQVVISPKFGLGAWAYFPILKRRLIVRSLAEDGISVRLSTRVLLVISEKLSGKDADPMLRDHLGHILLYLQHPRRWNDCESAMQEWNDWRRQ